jgi:hypothetical protein
MRAFSMFTLLFKKQIYQNVVFETIGFCGKRGKRLLVNCRLFEWHGNHVVVVTIVKRSVEEMCVIEEIQSAIVSLMHKHNWDRRLFSDALKWLSGPRKGDLPYQGGKMREEPATEAPEA